MPIIPMSMPVAKMPKAVPGKGLATGGGNGKGLFQEVFGSRSKLPGEKKDPSAASLSAVKKGLAGGLAAAVGFTPLPTGKGGNQHADSPLTGVSTEIPKAANLPAQRIADTVQVGAPELPAARVSAKLPAGAKERTGKVSAQPLHPPGEPTSLPTSSVEGRMPPGAPAVTSGNTSGLPVAPAESPISRTIRPAMKSAVPTEHVVVQPSRTAAATINADPSLPTSAAAPPITPSEATGEGQGRPQAREQGLSEARFAGLLQPGERSTRFVRGGKVAVASGRNAGARENNASAGPPVKAPAVPLAGQTGKLPRPSSERPEKIAAALRSIEEQTQKGGKRNFSLLLHRTESQTPLEGSRPGASTQMPNAPTGAGTAQVRLASGQNVPQSHVLAQVTSRLTAIRHGGNNNITIHLHPQELGEVKLDLRVNHSQVRAHLTAQNQQVQDVLEKHLPQLRQALQQQGLHLDHLQVSIDSHHAGEHGFFQQQQQQGQAQGRNSHRVTPMVAGETASEEVTRPVPGGGTGLSLRI